MFASYNILQRPVTNNKTEERTEITYSDESDNSIENVSESDESDSDPTKVKMKKQKICSRKFRKKGPKKNETNNDKYKVWLSQVQEEILTQNLVTCGVTNIYSDRNVESYDYLLRRDPISINEKSSDEDKDKGIKRFTNKRTYADRSNGKLRLETGISQLGLGKCDGDEDNSPNIILDLSTTAESEDMDVAEDICAKLGETKSELISKSENFIFHFYINV